MPVLPLLEMPSDPDAWHRVSAPGGYERWWFDAEDATGDLRLVATFWDGFAFHREYLGRYQRYRRRPTRVAPPVPGEYPCAHLAVYDRDQVIAQFTSMHPSGTFAASTERPEVRIESNEFRQEADGSFRVSLRGEPVPRPGRGPGQGTGNRISADLVFRPRLPVRPLEQAVLSEQASGALHRWIIAAALCQVEGTVRIGDAPEMHQDGLASRERTIDVRGLGYHDHNYGTAPIGADVKRWIHGRVLTGERALAFLHAEPRDDRLSAQTHYVEMDTNGVRQRSRGVARVAWSRTTSAGLAYPDTVSVGDAPRRLTLTRPRVFASTPYTVRVAYDAEWHEGERGRAFCEVAHPMGLDCRVLRRLLRKIVTRDDGRRDFA